MRLSALAIALSLALAAPLRAQEAPAAAPVVPDVTPAPASDQQPQPAPAPDQQPPPTPQEGEYPMDAAMLGAEVSEPEQPRLDLYGFADFTVWKPLVDADNPWLASAPAYSNFAVGNLNLYLDANLAPRWRSLIEVRFLYSPHGDIAAKSDGSISTTNNAVMDPAEYGHKVTWGGIQIERAWIEFQANQYLTIRAGQFLTPYGVWNVDHGSPTLIGIRRPYVIRETLLPERQTGFELYGGLDAAGVRFGYHLTLSNGRGNIPEYRDMDENKAIGGRLFGHYRGDWELTAGVSFYRGRKTTRTFRAVPFGESLNVETATLVENDELSLAGDLRFRWKGLHLQSEAVRQERAFTDRGRPMVANRPGYFQADTPRQGVYALAGYRFAAFGLMPYVMFEDFNSGGPGDVTYIVGDIPTTHLYIAGVNVRPWPNIVLKLEYNYARFPGAAKDSWGRASFSSLQSQIAWAF